nr:EOG090X0BCY [Artemia franciscana]
MSQRNTGKRRQLKTATCGGPLIIVVSGEEGLAEGDVELNKMQYVYDTSNASLLLPLELLDQDDSNQSEQSEEEIRQVKESGKKKKKKKEKPKKDDDEIDELNDIPVHDLEGDNMSKDVIFSRSNLLLADSKHLKPENELRRIFGSQVIQADRSITRMNNPYIAPSCDLSYGKQLWLSQPNPNWAHMPKLGLSMDLLDTSDGFLHFSFRHSKEYQKVQLLFLTALESHNPENIVALLQLHPGHIDSLLQLSDICRMGEDPQTATELVERALYVLETSFHPSFNLGSGCCRLDYRKPENRSFFMALFKRLMSVGQKGCYRTAMELCKVLFNLSPTEDPLGVLLMVDFYALRAQQYDWLLDFFVQFEGSRNLSQLPNWAYSVALAKFLLSQNDKEADKCLQDALIMFPGLLKPLVDKCNIQPDESVFKNNIFGPMAEYSQPKPLQLLVELYVARSFSAWKQPLVLPFLERNVQIALNRCKAGDEYHKGSAELRQRRYVGTPRNIYRHILISDLKEALVLVPPTVADGLLMFDPLPPKDSLPNYASNRVSSVSVPADDSSILSVFLRSLMPDYRPDAPARANQQGEVGNGEPSERSNGASLRRSVANLVDSMRDLLTAYNHRDDNDAEDNDD